MLALAPETLTDLRAQARTAAPAECCGLLVGTGVPGCIVVSSLRPAPHGSAARYRIAPDMFLATERAARCAGAWVCGVYHSHPTGGAEPSALDREQAWPGFVYLILAADDVRAWRLSDERRFEEVAISLRPALARGRVRTSGPTGTDGGRAPRTGGGAA